jgi:peptidyl-prolyl cis-trans isomerase SurA
VAYNTEVGEISKIVRTSFGYHIIKVIDKIPALGLVKAGHIMISVPKNADSLTKSKAENKINEIYKKLIEGEDFVSLVKQFSDDKASAAKDGDIPPFTSNRMLPEVVKAIASIPDNESYTKPVRTQFGWHIFKLYEKSGIGEYEEMYPEIKTKVARDSRSQISQDTVIKRLKEEYGFVENVNLISPFYQIVTKEIFEGKWNEKEANHLTEVLFSFADKHFSQQDFAAFLSQTQSKRTFENIPAYVNGKYAEFISKSIIDYENSILGQKYPEFKSIMQEYYDGILLFELTDNMVWSKAMKDTLGLKEFFNQNQKNYTWEKRIDAVIYQTRDKKTAKSFRKEIIKANKNGVDIQQVVDKYNEKSLLNVSSTQGIFEMKDHPVVSLIKWENGASSVVKFDNSFFVVVIKNVMNPKNKNLSEVRGIVIADYQNYLEALWINELKSKYNIELNSEVFNEVKKRFNK